MTNCAIYIRLLLKKRKKKKGLLTLHPGRVEESQLLLKTTECALYKLWGHRSNNTGGVVYTRE